MGDLEEEEEPSKLEKRRQSYGDLENCHFELPAVHLAEKWSLLMSKFADMRARSEINKRKLVVDQSLVWWSNRIDRGACHPSFVE